MTPTDPTLHSTTRRLHRHARQRLLGPPAGQRIAEPELTVGHVHIHRAPAPREVATKLGLATSTPVIVRSRTYRHHGRPVQAATSYLPAHVAAGTRIEHPDTGPGGIHARLAELDHTPAHFTERIHARIPTPQEAAALELTTPEHHVVLHLWRTATTATGIPVDVTVSVLAADIYVLTDSFTTEEPPTKNSNRCSTQAPTESPTETGTCP